MGRLNDGSGRLLESQLGEGVGAGLRREDAGGDGSPARLVVMTGGWGGDQGGVRFVGLPLGQRVEAGLGEQYPSRSGFPARRGLISSACTADEAGVAHGAPHFHPVAPLQDMGSLRNIAPSTPGAIDGIECCSSFVSVPSMD